MNVVGSPSGPPDGNGGTSSGLAHRAVGGMIWVAWGSAAMAVLQLVVVALLSRLLKAEDFGVVTAALFFIGFSLIFSQLGLGPALVHRPDLQPRHISTAFFASAGFGLLIAAILWLLAPAIASFYRMDALVPVVRVLALGFPINGISSVAENMVQRQFRFRLLANTNVLAYGLGYGLIGVVLALLGWGVWALVLAQLSQTVLRTVLLCRAAPPLLHPRPTRKAFSELIDYGVGQSAGRFAWFLANQADNLVVGRWLGAAALGFYGRAYQLMAAPTSALGDVLDKVLFPTMAHVQHDTRRLASAYLQGCALIALVTVPTGVVAAVLAPELVRVFLGRDWQAAVAPFQVLALGMMFRTSHRMSDSLARATGRVYRRAWRQAMYAVLVFAGALIGQLWGVVGVAVGVLGALLVNYLLMAHLSLSVGQISWAAFVRAQAPAFALAVILGGAAAAASAGSHHLGLPPLIGLMAGGAAALGTAALVIWARPTLALGEHGMRIGQTLRTYVLTRVRPGAWASGRMPK